MSLYLSANVSHLLFEIVYYKYYILVCCLFRLFTNITFLFVVSSDCLQILHSCLLFIQIVYKYYILVCCFFRLFTIITFLFVVSSDCLQILHSCLLFIQIVYNYYILVCCFFRLFTNITFLFVVYSDCLCLHLFILFTVYCFRLLTQFSIAYWSLFVVLIV